MFYKDNETLSFIHVVIELGIFACGWYCKRRCQPSVPQEIWRLLENTFFDTPLFLHEENKLPENSIFPYCEFNVYWNICSKAFCSWVTQWSFSLLHPLSLSCIHFFDLFPVIGFSFQVYIYAASRLLLSRALNWQETYIELLELLFSLRTPAAVSKCLKKLCISVTYNVIYSRVDIHFICRKLEI